MIVNFDVTSRESYDLFLKIKTIPRHRISGRTAYIPDEYASMCGLKTTPSKGRFVAPEWMYDYQSDVTEICLRKKRFAVFMECGYGKTAILLEFAKQACRQSRGSVLIVSPLMVIKQTLKECKRFYSDIDLSIEQIASKDLPKWLATARKGDIGITNYEAITDDLQPGKLAALILDESSLLKSAYGKWGTKLIDLGKGLEWKLALTGTPAPNDRIEFANHAVFLDKVPNVNAFLARYFVNRGQTDNRWELKPWALSQFYRDLSDWCIFIQNPGNYGWKDNAGTIPPINVTIHDVPMTAAQRLAVTKVNGDLFGSPGGITSRSKLSQIAKGFTGEEEVATYKPDFVKDLIDTWPEESTLVWCLYNREQEALARIMPAAASMSGNTPQSERDRIIEEFQAGRLKTLISKSKILGFGLNLQIATRQVFSGLQDSYEMFHQSVKRSNRIGSTKPLNVHIPVCDVERPMIETVLRKADRVQADTDEQEALYHEHSIINTLLQRTR